MHFDEQVTAIKIRAKRNLILLFKQMYKISPHTTPNPREIAFKMLGVYI